METIIKLVAGAVKAPFVAIFKTLITILNLIPTRVYEVHGARGFAQENRPDLRVMGSIIPDQKAHLGTVLIAFTRGSVVKRKTASGQAYWSIWTEVYRDIQSKWNW